MDIISAEQANRLYWLDRYTERVYTTVRIYFKKYDVMIDENEDSYEEFCQMVDIPNIYTSKEDFLKRYPFDPENPDSIISNLTRAYDNAIVLRESISSEALSYIQLAIYEINRAAESLSPLMEMQEVLDDLLAFWGIIDDKIDSEQIRINELHEETLVPLAEEANVDFIWVHGASTVLESTFAYSLNSIKTPVLVVEMGVGMRITRAYGDQLVDGIFRLMHKLGIWKGEAPKVRKPIISRDPDDVCYLNASVGGVFIPEARHWVELKKGDIIGKIVDPLCGRVLDEVTAPIDGILFTIRDYPIVDEGSLMGRLLRKEAYGNE